ncbi:MAG: hemerythrin domain-containing protein [Candidatus Brocadia sinica]|uniref:hemerythrin domain-containing protein n=1 Tax=Candidatus Brocadia TaxID=380240 RepID=UPI001E3EE2AE|nr:MULTISPECIES: hemerythrin domain-containing protein [Brocadia]MCK6468930.1 hemerythrin domain-containing protein [Candidatus Brocadia sinica]
MLNKEIKNIIEACPEVGRILDEYGIGCVPCSVGSCLLKDIVGIHNLDPEQEATLMYRIEKAIYPDRNVSKPVVDTTKKSSPKKISYSPPVKKLVDEHVLIKRLLALIPVIVDYVESSIKVDKELILSCVDFIRTYADKYHHMKEEDILFKYVDEKAEIILIMYKDHDTGRGHIRQVVEGAEKGNKAQIREHLLGYRDLLTQHIKKEDEILYPWIDRQLSTTQVGEMFRKCNDADASVGDELPRKYEKLIAELEEKFLQEVTK